MSWPEATVAADVDEVEFSYLGREDLGLVVRHSFAGGWTVRVTFGNHILEPLTLGRRACLGAGAQRVRPGPWPPGRPGRTRSPRPGGAGPLLGGELMLGTWDGVSAEGIGLGPFTLGPLGRYVVQWRWDWFDHPQAFHQDRFLDVPRDLVLPAGDMALIAADDDEAVVAPGVDLVRRGGELELCRRPRSRSGFRSAQAGA